MFVTLWTLTAWRTTEVSTSTYFCGYWSFKVCPNYYLNQVFLQFQHPRVTQCAGKTTIWKSKGSKQILKYYDRTSWWYFPHLALQLNWFKKPSKTCRMKWTLCSALQWVCAESVSSIGDKVLYNIISNVKSTPLSWRLLFISHFVVYSVHIKVFLKNRRITSCSLRGIPPQNHQSCRNISRNVKPLSDMPRVT